jgi:hypothetical protein
VKCPLCKHFEVTVYGNKYVHSVAEIKVSSSMESGKTVKPFMALPTSYKNIPRDKQDFQNKLKTTNELQRVGYMPLWSTTDNASVMTKHAEGILQQDFLRATRDAGYSYICTDSNMWLVRGSIIKSQEHQNWQHKKNITIPNPVPAFVQTRTIRLVDGNLICSSAFYERFGLPCRHQFTVLGRGPTANDLWHSLP